MDNQLTKELTEAFLRWQLPESVRADDCATKQQAGRTGTNLLSYTEAYAMFSEIVTPKIETLLLREGMEHGRTIEERDEAEEAADKMASLILNEPIDWPNHGAKWSEAIEEMGGDAT